VASTILIIEYLAMRARALPGLTPCILPVLVHKYACLYILAVIMSGVVEVLTSLAQPFFGKEEASSRA